MTRNRINRRTVLVALAGLLVSSLSARAGQSDDVNGLEKQDDHDLARRALREGKVRPLADILAMVKDRLDGKIIEVRFEREDGRYVYEIKVLNASGHLREVNVDAASGEIIKIEGD
jgi:uncharacterized membrane protein YkoI